MEKIYTPDDSSVDESKRKGQSQRVIEKLNKLKAALKYHIEWKYGDDPLSVTKDKLGYKYKADLSKVLNMRVLPSIERIFAIEEKLGIEILKINFPHLSETEKDYIGEAPTNTIYPNIVHYFGDSFKKLIGQIKDQIEMELQKDGDNELEFVVRDKKNYYSINLVPKHYTIGGIHLLMIRFSDREKLRIHFVAPDIYLERFIDYSSYGLTKTGIDTIYVPSKEGRTLKDFERSAGQPVIIIKENEIRPETIAKICKLTKVVYAIQKGKTVEQIQKML